MKIYWIATFSLLFSVASLSAQQPTNTPGHSSPPAHTLPNPPDTTEAWLYTQELQRYEDPVQAVRRKAEKQAAERLQRIAALKWYGQSNARPSASPIPSMDYYSPSWVGNSLHPYHWSGISQSPRAIYVLPDYVR